eukprot:88672_1
MKIIETFDKLKVYKPQIIEFIKQKKLDGSSITEMGRKSFMKQAASYVKNKKLTIQFGKLYSFITNVDIFLVSNNNKNIVRDQKLELNSKSIDDVWSNNPQSILECNTHQIVFLLQTDIIDKLNNLKSVKSEIIDYFTINCFDGNKIINMKRKEFISLLMTKLNDKKLTGQVGKLYNLLKQYDISSYVKNNVIQQEELKQYTVKKDKFVTSTKHSSELYYAFGEQYRYTSNLKHHPLYIKPRYTSLKEELIQYLISVNRIHDEHVVATKQIVSMESINPKFAQLLSELFNYGVNICKYTKSIVLCYLKDINTNEITPDNICNLIILYYCDSERSVEINLWASYNIDVISDSKDEFEQIIQIHCINCSRIKHMLQHLLPNASQRFHGEDLPVALTILSFYQIQKLIRKKLRECLLQIVHHHKTVAQLMKELQELVDKPFSTRYTQCITLLNKVFVKSLKPCLNLRSTAEFGLSALILKLFNKIEEQRSQKEVMTAMVHVFYHISGFNNEHFCKVLKCKGYFTLTWSDQKSKEPTLSEVKKEWCVFSAARKAKELRMIFTVDIIDLTELHNTIRSIFSKRAAHILTSAVDSCKNMFVEKTNLERFEHYAQKAVVKCSTQSIKQLKATWYHGINEQHEINPNDLINQNHIIALIYYSSESSFCTAFRETYRRKHPTETLSAQKERHAIFATTGKLLYESFVFFGSKDSKVKTLYHGMSVELMFPTLYCAFDAPTSTTTETSVALTFCESGSQGIVLKFMSSDSSEYIKTLDMGLFSCFDHECEHLIFETRLHIKDIYVPR